MGKEEQAVILMPLLEGLDGVNKMSKSLGNYIGITEQPKDMFGKIMSINDDLMLRYYELLSHITLEDFNQLKKAVKSGTLHPKTAKENLALEIVERYWDKNAAFKAKEEFEHIFKDKGRPEELPSVNLKWEETEMWIPKIMKLGGIVSSTSEAVRLIKQGGLTIDDNKCDNPDAKLKKGTYIFKAGKRKFLKITGE